MSPPIRYLALVLSIASAFALASCSTPLPGLTEQPASSSYKPYPLENCLVTAEPLDSKGGSIVRYYQGHEIKVCCRPCLNAFKSAPEAFMAKLQ